MADSRQYWAHFDDVGEERVRQDLAGSTYGEPRRKSAKEWLAYQESRRSELDAVSSLDEARAANVSAREANELARAANELAASASAIARDAAASARDSAEAARNNNIIAAPSTDCRDNRDRYLDHWNLPPEVTGTTIMPKRKEPELTPEEQRRRFFEAAKKAGVTKSEEKFEKAFKTITSKVRQKSTRNST